MRGIFSSAAFIILLSSIAIAQENVRIGGSDTLILLGQRFEQQYSRHFSAVSFHIGGGGIPVANEQLTNDRLDVLQSEGNGAGAVSFPIGIQAIVVYVNQNNPIAALTVAQLRSIFLGKITNWSQLGGPNKAIVLYAGESSTGMEAYFQESVLRGEEPYPFEGKSNTRDLLRKLAEDDRGIGYGSLDALPGARAVAIKLGPASVGVVPDSQSIRSRQYPISRYIYWTLARKPSEGLKNLCAWVLSPEGQLVVESVGFQPLLPDQRKHGLSILGIKSMEAQNSARHSGV